MILQKQLSLRQSSYLRKIEAQKVNSTKEIPSYFLTNIIVRKDGTLERHRLATYPEICPGYVLKHTPIHGIANSIYYECKETLPDYYRVKRVKECILRYGAIEEKNAITYQQHSSPKTIRNESPTSVPTSRSLKGHKSKRVFERHSCAYCHAIYGSSWYYSVHNIYVCDICKSKYADGTLNDRAVIKVNAGGKR